MKYILVGSRNAHASEAIRESLGSQCRVQTADDVFSCIDVFQRRRFDVTFLELDYLRELMRSRGLGSYKKALQHFRNVFPTAPIIALCSLLTLLTKNTLC